MPQAGAGSTERSALTDSQQCFFITEVHLDIPALKVSFDDLARIQCGVGADEIGGIAIEKLRSFAGTISKRRDDDELQNLSDAGGAPQQIFRSL